MYFQPLLLHINDAISYLCETFYVRVDIFERIARDCCSWGEKELKNVKMKNDFCEL